MDTLKINGYIDDSALFVSEWSDASPYIIARTSGSTGTPKPIRLLKSDMESSARITCDFFGITSSSLLHLPLSPSYIAGKMMIVRSIVSGAELMVEKPSNRPLASGVERTIDLTAVVPSQIDGLLESSSVSRINSMIIGGAAIPQSLERRLLDTPIECYATYGMTETCSHVALRRLGTDTYMALGDVGFDTDARGCLIIHTPHLSVGSVSTNDVVELVDSRCFRWKGRFDNVINSGGIKIFPEEVERALGRIITDREYYITSRSSDKWGEELVLVIEGEGDADRLVSEMASMLPRYHVPKHVVFCPCLRRTYSGKIIRECPDN